MPRHIVCLSFDFDALSLPIARGTVTPTAMSRGEFGTVAAPRLVDLLGAHGIRGSWFVPGHTLETFPEICRAIHQAGHEIGHHGWRHIAPASLDRAGEEAELTRANEAIRKLTGRFARGYRSPAWDLSPHTVELLLAHGFDYDSSMMGHDYLPYFAREGDQYPADQPAVLGRPTNLLEMPISWSLDDYPHFEFQIFKRGVLPGLQTADGVLRNWSDDFDYLTEILDWGILTYTFHPFVIGRGHRMKMLDRLIRHLKARGAVFLTMEEAAVEARGRLEGRRAAAE
ncbi:polysaccharide deacetylase family protein [Desertibaculum subflavum]|uniref:polysaccharide deacetylase family protein n=1 Tax=Desertibaculum subflavum TaxID=2268458 RepID=UPI000E6645C1